MDSLSQFIMQSTFENLGAAQDDEMDGKICDKESKWKVEKSETIWWSRCQAFNLKTQITILLAQKPSRRNESTGEPRFVKHLIASHLLC